MIPEVLPPGDHPGVLPAQTEAPSAVLKLWCPNEGLPSDHDPGE
jgi:hypothetical protein